MLISINPGSLSVSASGLHQIVLAASLYCVFCGYRRKHEHHLPVTAAVAV